MTDAVGSVAILNVGAGDIKLSFDKQNPVERIRAARIVKDLLRRGFALLVEIPDDTGKGKVLARATDFDENTCEYVIADFDPEIAAAADQEEPANGERESSPTPRTEAAPAPAPAGKRGRGRPRKVDAAQTRTVAVGRSAGG